MQQRHALQRGRVLHCGIGLISLHHIPATIEHTISKDALRRVQLIEGVVPQDGAPLDAISGKMVLGIRARALRQLSLHGRPIQTKVNIGTARS